METNDVLIGLFGFFVGVFLLIATPYGAYKYGRYSERRALTQALADSIEGTCNECYNDGGKVGYKQGYDQGYKQGKDKGIKMFDALVDEEGGHR